MKILILEDDPFVAQAVQSLLKGQHAIDLASNLREANYLREDSDHELVIIDLNLPDGSGASFCQGLRAAAPEIKILILTAEDSPKRIVELLDCGADDYIKKPFHPQELLARIKALSRRSGDVQLPNIRIGNGKFNLANRCLESPDGAIPLRRAEFELLSLLTKHPNRLIPFDKLHQLLWPHDDEPFSNALSAHLSRLRGKLKLLSASSEVVTTKGQGIMYRPQKGGGIDKKLRHTTASRDGIQESSFPDFSATTRVRRVRPLV